MAYMTRFRAGKCFLRITKLNSIFYPISTQKYEKIAMAPMGKIKQCFKPS